MEGDKVSQYFFIIAAVISILDGAFELDEQMRALKYMILIVGGVVVGIMRHQKQKEFVVAGLAVIITGFILVAFLQDLYLLESFGVMIYNFVIFLSAATVVVGIEQIAGIISLAPHLDEELPPAKTKRQKLTQKEIEEHSFHRVWGTIILVAVALSFIVLLAESFFDVSEYQVYLVAIDGAITLLFIVDLIILYRQAKGFGDFIKHNIFDIIAAVPTVGVLRLLKIIRAARIVRVFSKGLKLSKTTKLYKTTKFFSQRSYFNQVEQEAEMRHQRKTPSRPRKRTTKKPAAKRGNAKKKASKR